MAQSSNSSGREPLLPSHQGQAQNYGATAQNKVKQAAGQAKQTAKRAEQKLDNARPDIEYAVAALKAGKLPSESSLVSLIA